MPKLCQYENCRNRASYAEFYGIPIRCKTHKEHFKGQYSICHCGSKYPIFNFTGLSPEYCAKCKVDGMYDLKHKKCNCGLARPSYNYKGLNAEYCMSCKLNEMIDVKHEKCNCGLVRPSYNLKGLDAKYCVSCKTPDMIDVINKKCKANYCLGSLGSSKYKGYCSSCYQQLFPNDPLTFQIRSKTKEIAVRDFINQNFVGFQHDKPLWTGNCTCINRRRIDHRLLIGNTLLCIETDENQHKNYNTMDEELRYDDLYMLHSGKFIFIRFNPDKYKNAKGKTVNPMLYTRLPVLKNEIEKQLHRITQDNNNDLLEIVKLYYDNYN
jgi:hypothetical protein